MADLPVSALTPDGGRWEDLPLADRLDEIDRYLSRPDPMGITVSPQERHAGRFEALERCRAYLVEHPRSRKMRQHERALIDAINARPGRFRTLEDRDG